MVRAEIMKFLTLGVILTGLAGCGSSQQMVDAVVAPSAPRLHDGATSAVFLDLLAGRYDDALAGAERSLKADPADAYALLAAAIVHQNAGRFELARRHYQRLLQLGDPLLATRALTLRSWSHLSPYSFREIVDANMVRLTSDQEFQTWMAAEKSGARDGGVSLSDENVIRRFSLLKRLHDMKMIDAADYTNRRSVNLSGLLPMTAPPSAARMAAPVPAAENLLGRLRLLDDALRDGTISSQTYIAERAATLDALLPATPTILPTPPVPPQGVLEAAAMIRRLERLQARGLISGGEMNREKAAIEKAIRAAQSR